MPRGRFFLPSYSLIYTFSTYLNIEQSAAGSFCIGKYASVAVRFKYYDTCCTRMYIYILSLRYIQAYTRCTRLFELHPDTRINYFTRRTAFDPGAFDGNSRNAPRLAQMTTSSLYVYEKRNPHENKWCKRMSRDLRIRVRVYE